MISPASNERGIEKLKAPLRHLARFGSALGALALFYSVAIWLVSLRGVPLDDPYALVTWVVLLVGGICITTPILKGMPGWIFLTIIVSLFQIVTASIAVFIMTLAGDWGL